MQLKQTIRRCIATSRTQVAVQLYRYLPNRPRCLQDVDLSSVGHLLLLLFLQQMQFLQVGFLSMLRRQLQRV